jgi:hypothetical protein
MIGPVSLFDLSMLYSPPRLCPNVKNSKPTLSKMRLGVKLPSVVVVESKRNTF